MGLRNFIKCFIIKLSLQLYDNACNGIMAERIYMTNDLTPTNRNLPTQFKVETNQNDMLIPFLKVIQSLSDELIQGKDKYNPNLKAGDLYDSVTKTIFRNSSAVICGMKKYYAEWTPQIRGRLVSKHLDNSEVVKNAQPIGNGNLKTATGNDLLESYGAILIMKNENGLVLPVRFTFSKSSFMVGKELNTIIVIYQSGGVPKFDVNSILVSNTKGSWFKPHFTFAGYETDNNVLALATHLHGIADSIILG